MQLLNITEHMESLDISEITPIIAIIATMTATLTAAIIAVWNLQRINKINNIKSHYNEFWNDEEIRNVRIWLANHEAYQEIKPILEKVIHLNSQDESEKVISKKEYEKIDQIDKFINMIMLIREIGRSGLNFSWFIRLFNKKYGSTWEELMLEYWLVAPIEYNRIEFERYIQIKYDTNFYPKLDQANRRRLKRK